MRYTQFGARMIRRSHRGFNAYGFNVGDVDLHPGDHVLDLGAGDATFAHEAETRICPGVAVVRMDLGYRNVPPDDPHRAVAADIRQLPFKDESFDKIISCWLFPHLYSEEITLAVPEVHRTLRLGGTAFIGPGSVDGKSLSVGSIKYVEHDFDVVKILKPANPDEAKAAPMEDMIKLANAAFSLGFTR